MSAQCSDSPELLARREVLSTSGKLVPSSLYLCGALEDLLAAVVELQARSGEDPTELYNEVRSQLDAVWAKKGR